VGHLNHLRAGVRSGDGESADTHDGEIDDIVANVAKLFEGDAGCGADLLGGGKFVGLSLVDELELQVAGSDGDRLRLALGDDADADAAETGE